MEIGEHDERGNIAFPLSPSFLHQDTAGALASKMKIVISNPNQGSPNPTPGLLNPNQGLNIPDGVNATNAVIHSALNSNCFTTSADVRIPASLELKEKKPVKYRECLKNHAVTLGAHTTDGCGEFMPSGAEGTLEALTCAACFCHRNFHRREAEEGERAVACPDCRFHGSFGERNRVHGRSCAFPSPLPLSLPTLHAAHMIMGEPDDFVDGCALNSPCSPSSLMKRSRTKFTMEQKEHMASFANTLGWRIQKQDEDAVMQFCSDIGIKRHVLKVWMHNNKLTLGKKHTPCLTMTPGNPET